MEAQEQQSEIDPQTFIQYVLGSENIAADMDEDTLKSIAQDVVADYELDKDSMADWTAQMERGVELAKLVKQDKTHPFEGAANVKYPLVARAALQFNARSYPAIVPGDRVVKARVWGDDPDGSKAARADRTSEHMSWQLAADIPEWEASTDKLLVQLPVVGEMFRKWWRDPATGKPRCRLIKPGCLIVNSNVEDMTQAPRMTEELALYPHEIKTRIKAKKFANFEYTDDAQDKQGPQDFLEQHTRLDLDDDGYFEPYVVTVHKDTQKVVRIVADFTERDVSFETQPQPVPQTAPVMDPMTGQPAIDPMTGQPIMQASIQMQEVPVGILAIERGTHFVDFEFMPSMDGGFHGTGLGLLLGDLSESVNSIINMMLDAGHYAALGGGWIGSEMRMKGGSQRMRPGEFKMVPSNGQDIRSAIVEKTFPGPDAVLFQLMGVLIEAGEQVSSTSAIMTGDSGGQNMQPTTLMALIEQGMKVFTAVYKRIFRSLKKEFALIARMNAEGLSPQEYNAFHDGQEQFDPQQDYASIGMDIQPVADPNSVIKSAELAKAQVVLQMAESGLVDRAEAVRRVTEALDIEDSDALQPQVDPAQQAMQAQMMQMQAAAAEADIVQKQVDIQLTLAKVNSERAKAMKDLSEIEQEERAQRLDAMKMVLEDEQKRLASLLQGVGRLERQRDNAGPQGGNGQGSGSGAPALVGGLLGGQPIPGIAPGSGPSNPEMGGGLF